MLAFFRSAVSSIWGKAIFGLILIAFVVTLYEGRSPLGGINILGGSSLAQVGSVSIGESDVRRRANNQLEAARQQNPGLDIAQFVAAGGVDSTLRQMIDARVLTEFGRQNGLVASDRLVGSLLNRIPAFKGPTGNFDQKAYEGILARLKVSDADFRKEFQAEAVINMLQIPVRGGVRLPQGVAEPYAALLLEGRKGLIATIPSDRFTSLPAPTDAELSTFYSRNVARYTLPERRVVRYALFTRDRFKGKVAPTDEEVARFYKVNAAAFAAKDSRGFTQLIVQQQADAEKALAAVKAGKSITEVGKSLGLAPLVVAPLERPAFEKQTSPAVAAAAFAAPLKGLATLAKSAFGWHVIRVDSIDAKAAQSLEQARSVIVTQLTEQKIDEAAAAFVAQLDDEAADGATFDDLVKKYDLTATVTPAVTQSGADPDQPSYKPAPEMGVILRDAYRAEPDDDPVAVQLGNGREFALWKLDRVVASAPRPLAQIRAQVEGDARAEAAAKAAGVVANAIVAKVRRGVPLAQALADAGVKLPPPSPAAARRIDIIQARGPVPPPLALMFSIGVRQARALAMPDNQGYFVVYLNEIEGGNPASVPGLLDNSRTELSKLAGDEYLQQFVAAARAQVGVKRNDAALATLKKALSGGGTGQ